LDQRWSTTLGVTFASSPYSYSINKLHVNGILSVGGPKANGLSRYFNDFNFAIDREGPNDFALANNGVVTGTAPTSNPSLLTNDFFPVSSWATTKTDFGYSNPDNSAGYAVIAVARDINGTRGLSVYGWDGRDTYWASAWAALYLNGNQTVLHNIIPAGTVAIILKIGYTTADKEPISSPNAFTIVKALGTITEFGSNVFTTNYGYDVITGPTSWTGLVVPPTYVGGDWWFAKVPTTSTATVQYDP